MKNTSIRWKFWFEPKHIYIGLRWYFVVRTLYICFSLCGPTARVALDIDELK